MTANKFQVWTKRKEKKKNQQWNWRALDDVIKHSAKLHRVLKFCDPRLVVCFPFSLLNRACCVTWTKKNSTQIELIAPAYRNEITHAFSHHLLTPSQFVTVRWLNLVDIWGRYQISRPKVCAKIELFSPLKEIFLPISPALFPMSTHSRLLWYGKVSFLRFHQRVFAVIQLTWWMQNKSAGDERDVLDYDDYSWTLSDASRIVADWTFHSVRSHFVCLFPLETNVRLCDK